MIQQRRAIEALRSGVPNSDAVSALGTSQHAILEAFEQGLGRVEGGRGSGGILIGGDFGSGKSHLLEYLQHHANERRFVTSKIVISKETPLHDPAKVFRAAVANTTVPGRRGSALTAITSALRYDTPAFGALLRWVQDPRSGLNERFAATLFLMETLQEPEFTERILGFWSGDAIAVGEINKKLRECGEKSSWTFSKVSVRDLAIQRFRFLAKLIIAAGYAGWVLLFDEVELIGRYSLLQRGRSYAELARWTRGFESAPIDGAMTVMAITHDYAEAVLHRDKHDWDNVPNKLRSRGVPADELAADRAEIGMRVIAREMMRLSEQDPESIRVTCEKLRTLHSEAYAWVAPAISGTTTLASRRMREYVRSWIYEWDLRRIDPTYVPEIEIETVSPEYGEDSDLEGESSGDWEDPAE